MIIPTPRRLVFLTAFFPALAAAQVTAPGSAPTLGNADPVVLSPFVVDSTSDEGYRATSTLAGSRLRTELKDVAASVTVLTNEFLDDLGATDLSSALAFVAGAENDLTSDPTTTNSLNQGYVGGDFGDTNTRSGEVRVRGLGRASTTANYIQVLGSPDRYNIDRSEFLRGANSILFGLAEPAGLMNYSTKVANLQRNIVKVDTKVDNFGSTRGVLDVSRVLLKDRLAVRGVGLYSDRRYEVKDAFQRDKRFFGTVTSKPLKNTTVRAFYEKTDLLGRRPNYRTVQDNVSDWLVLYNQYAGVLTPAQLAAAFYWDPSVASPPGGVPANSVITAGGQTVDLGVIRHTMDGKDNATALFYDNRNWNTPLLGGATLVGTRTATGAAASPTNTRTYFARSASPRENTSGYMDPQVTNKGIFPYNEYEIGSLPGNYRWERGDKINLSLDQKVTDNLYLSVAYQKEKLKQEQGFSPISQQQQISIDVNTKLPDGRTNPNFLRPFIYGRSIGSYDDLLAENVVVQANYDFDFKQQTDRLGWMGFHRLTSLYTKASQERQGYRWDFQVLNNRIPNVLDVPENNAALHVYQYWYIGDAVKPGDTSLHLTGLPNAVTALAGQSYAYTYYDNTSRTWKRSPEPLQVGRSLLQNGRNFTEQNNDGVGASLQSFFWNRRIVTLFGYRKDKVESFTHSLPTANPPYLGETRADYLINQVPDFADSVATSTQSIVFHATTWLRIFANRSENFAATAPRTDNLFRPIPPQSGKTEEVGLGLTLFDGKLVLRAAAYQSSQNYATSGAAAGTANLRIEAVEDALYTALESAGRLSEWSTIGPDGQKSTNQYDKPLNISASEDSVSKGWEAEAVYNPTRNWRIAASLSKLDNRSSHIGRELGDFIAARADFYRKFFAEGLRQDGTNKTNPTASTLLSDRFRDTVAINYVSNIVTEGTSNPGVPEYIASFVTNYRFAAGRLKGVSVGGNLRWEKSKSIGYQQTNTTFNVGGLDGVPGFIADRTKPYFGKSTLSGGLMTNYSRKIFRDRLRWRVQLNAQNCFGEHGLRVIRANPDGSPIWGVAPPRTYELSNSFEF